MLMKFYNTERKLCSVYKLCLFHTVKQGEEGLILELLAAVDIAKQWSGFLNSQQP